MNEELRIVISAITDEAKKNLADVRKELDGIEGAGTQAGKEVDAAMKGMGKAIGATIAVVAALTTAMAALGRKAQEVNKGIARLNSTFESAGSSAAQATDTYRELFGIFGDHDRAIETAQSLARVTTEADNLAQYYDILAGAAAKYGDGLQGEALAEQISETVASGKAVGDLARVLVEAGISEDAFNNSLAQTTSLEERELLVRQTLNNVLGTTGSMYRQANSQTIAYNKSQADLNIALAQATSYTTPLLTALNMLSTTLLTYLAPAFRTISIYLTGFIQLLAEAVEWVGGFFGVVGGKSSKTSADIQGYQKAMASYTNSLNKYFGATESGADGALKSVKELKKQTMGFDELNVVSNPASASAPTGGVGSVGGLGNLPPAPDPSDFGIGGDLFNTEEFEKDLEEAKEKIKAIGVLIGLVAAGLLAWKIGSFIADVKVAKKLIEIGAKDGALAYQKAFGKTGQKMLDEYKARLQNIAGTMMIVAGALLLIDGYSKAWTEGVDWASFAEMIAGVGLIVGGVALTIGGVAAPIALIVGAIALLVVGIKDLVENGYSMEAVILVAVAAIGVLIGVVWALNAALLANPITWIVVAIMALVAAFVVLWNECDAFRNFFIAIWDAIVIAFEATVAWFKQAGKDIASFFVSAWNAIKTAWNAVGKFFSDCWNAIKSAFSAVGKWFSDIFTGAWNGIKKAFSAVGSFFKGIWDTIKSIFSSVGSAIAGAVSKAFSSAINWVLEKAIGIINGFITAINFAIKIINAIPGVNINELKKLDVPKLAKGGIINSATLAVVGEQGKEAVMPLENNTEWIDILASRLASKQSAPSRIALVLDGKELGYATINSINNITRQTGELKLALL